MTNQEWETKVNNLRELIELHARESNERFSIDRFIQGHGTNGH